MEALNVNEKHGGGRNKGLGQELGQELGPTQQERRLPIMIWFL
jgi:hypothetical protein